MLLFKYKGILVSSKLESIADFQILSKLYIAIIILIIKRIDVRQIISKKLELETSRWASFFNSVLGAFLCFCGPRGLHQY